MDETRRALVLGSGGTTGLAWQAGVLAGLASAGLSLRADLVVGTSGGALVGALLAGNWSVDDVIGALLDRSAPATGLPPAALARLLVAQVAPSRRHALAALGRRAARHWNPEAAERWVESVAGDLAGRPWPEPLVVVATEAESGRPAYFSARNPVDLAEAVAASCALPGVFPAVRIEGRLYFDGGLRSPANLDVAGAADRILAVAPLKGSVRANRRPAEQAARCEAAGARVVVIEPDNAGRRAIGLDVLASTRVPQALAAGRELGRRRSEQAMAVWS